MKLFYVDDSGNTGKKLDDKQQPLFLLGGVIIDVKLWKKVNDEIIECKKKYNIEDELHAKEIMNGEKSYKEWNLDKKIDFFKDIFNIIKNNNLKVFYFKVNKSNFKKYFENRFGKNFYENISISPYLLAFSYILQIVDAYLENINDTGMLILDRQDEEKVPAVKVLEDLRFIDKDSIKIKNLIETTFFVDSKYSNLIQLSDLVAYHLKRYFECEVKNVSKKQKNIRMNLFTLIKNNIIKVPFDYGKHPILKWLESYSGNCKKEKPLG